MTQPASQRPIAIWLLICCAAIFAMVVLGGVTRLTGSGLSIVRWEPITGILPPLDQTAWEQVFQLYQESPEYQKKNRGMSLEGFKTIFWFEYAHRVLGRLIGLIFAVPLLYFVARRRISHGLVPRLLFVLLLGGLQGALGWYMVKSGLVNDPHVSPYRLTAHLGLAILIYGYLFWLALDLLFPRGTAAGGAQPVRLGGLAPWLTLLVLITALSGGFVAGTRAGFAYNSFPLMGGHWIPEGLATLDPLWRNFFENVTTVQFDHRLLATAALVTLLVYAWALIRQPLSGRLRLGVVLLVLTLGLQYLLGVATLLMRVPVALGAAHQGVAVLLLTACLFLWHQLRQTAPAP